MDEQILNIAVWLKIKKTVMNILKTTTKHKNGCPVRGAIIINKNAT